MNLNIVRPTPTATVSTGPKLPPDTSARLHFGAAGVMTILFVIAIAVLIMKGKQT